MLVAILSDTHLPLGSRRLPEAAVETLRAAELILHAGDFSTLAVLEDLCALGPPVVAVHGNVDDDALRSALPERTQVTFGGVAIGMVHDAGPKQGRGARLRSIFPDVSAVVFGHSHIPLHEESEGFQIFNPGSPTDPRRQPHPTMGLARIREGEISFEHLVL
jgi:uncharacterized protein